MKDKNKVVNIKIYLKKSKDLLIKKASKGKCSANSDESVSDAEQKKFSENDLPKKDKKDKKQDFTNTYGLPATLFAFLSQNKLLAWLGELTKSPATIYDKALDAAYLKTHIGGGDHRLFDGGHDIFNAWNRIREASPDDSFQQEVLGYVSALWKDVTTTKGLPFVTVSKENFEASVKALDWIPGVDRKYLYDLLSFDAMEILSTSLGAVGVLFALKKKDQKVLAELLGSMGISSILSANPIMGIFVIATAGYAYKIKSMEFDKIEFGKSVLLSISATALFGALGIPILFKLILIATLTKLLRKQVLDNEEFHAFVKENVLDRVQENKEEIYASVEETYDLINQKIKTHLKAS